MRCGCTMNYPGCTRGEALFAALIQAQHRLNATPREDREEQWAAFSLVRLAYLDHLHSWRQGDLRVRHQGGTWLVEQHRQDRWPLQFGTSNEAELRHWLREGFWRYAQLEDVELRDRLTGYYHRRPSPALLSDSSQAPTRPLAQVVMGQQWEHARSTEPVKPELDCKTWVALLIAVQISHASHPLTPLESLALQRKAVDLLVSSGEQPIRAEDITWIQAVMEEAAHLCEMQQQAIVDLETLERSDPS
ncbi:MAG TPA: hypothetical protein VFB60_02365 [Ktedonobacteraceae bacterium]|nr:hypothetical protein [Ktedonobacteraceae bacterium]